MNKNTPIYMAVSGGGFHTHTAMSAWISGLLRHTELQNLEQIFKNVRGISGNSGGSWFISHLGYSNEFVNALIKDSKSAQSTWSSSGYLGKMGENFFSTSKGNLAPEERYLAKYVEYLDIYAQLFPSGHRRWYEFVTSKVYLPLGQLGNRKDDLSTMEDKNLNEMNDRVSWFQDKDFIIATALLNSTVVLHGTGGILSTNQFYSANPDDGSKSLSNVVPMFLSGVPEGRKAAPLFMSGSQRLTYRQNNMENKLENSELRANHAQNIRVLDATIASSSAFAILASENTMREMLPNYVRDTLLSWVSWTEADFAPAIKFAENHIEILKTLERKTIKDYAEKKIARVAGGGFVDNSSVAFQLRHMKENDDLINGFHLVLFMNASSESITYYGHEMNVGIATLFGHDGLSESEEAKKKDNEDNNVWLNPFGKLFMKIPSPHVFEAETWEKNKAKLIWSWKSKPKKISLQAYEVPVTTVENKVYGIPAGVTGIMYIFEVTQLGSFAMPRSQDDLGTYKVLFETIRNKACQENQAWPHLKMALGLEHIDRDFSEDLSNSLRVFDYKVVTVNERGKTVNERGQKVNREKDQAKYFTEDLENGVTLDMVYIPGGSFRMGSPEGEGYDTEKPQHEVTVQPFFMGKFQVTQAQWKAIASLSKVKLDLESDPSCFKGDELPVEKVSWEEAEEFCQRLSKQTGQEYRLPTEAEWEYACRAGTTTPFHFGETITGELANYRARSTYASEPKGEYRKKTTPVGSFLPNAFGLYDIHGNVWELCEDDWHDNYQGAPTDGSAWTSENISIKVIRGGSWNAYPDNCRSAYRNYCSRDLRVVNFGVRVVCVFPRNT